MRRLIIVFFVALIVAGAVAVARGSDEPADEVTLDGELRFDNIVDARAELAASEDRWAASEPDGYIWRVFTNLPEPAIETTVDGGVVVDTVAADHAWDSLPRTPEAAFEIVDGLIRQIEDDPGREGNWSECTGLFFSFDFDPTYGVPLDWGDSDPCSDVIGVYFEFEPLG